MSVALPPASAAGGEAELVVTVLDVNGDPAPFGDTFTASTLAALPDDVVNLDYLNRASQDSGSLTGPSINTVIGALGLPVSAIDTIDFFCPGFGDPMRLSARAHDLDPPGSADYPFMDDPRGDAKPPAFGPLVASDASQNSITFGVGIRKPEASDPSLSSQQWGFIADQMTMTIHLDDRVLPTEIDAPGTVKSGGTVTLKGTVDDAVGDVSYTWHFGDGTEDVTTKNSASVTHRYVRAGTWDATVAVTDATGSKGFSTTTVSVTKPAAATTSPPPTTPGQGTAATTAPNRGPATGNGPRVGGVATGRTGPTGAGTTFDPRSSGAPSATASGSATPQPGAVISGFALSEPSLAVAATRVGSTPRNNAAAASRAGSTTNRVGEWTLGGLAVVVLLGVGVLSERRRPRHRGRPAA